MRPSPTTRGVLALVLACLSLACGGASSWEAAVADANESKKVLIVEFYADWCTPCSWFETNVLADAEVKRALERVEFRRYDYDSTKGKHYAHRLGVHAIPSVVAIDRDGQGFRKLKGAVPKGTFIQFLHWSQAQLYPDA